MSIIMSLLYTFKLTFLGLFANILRQTGYLQNMSKPNIIFIMADDLGFNDIGYHAKIHGSAIRTPILDKLAESGVKLENYYVHQACTPTRGALLTSRYDIHIGLQHFVIKPTNPNALSTKYQLLPQRLKKCGYDTHMVGKWHLGFYKSKYLPWNRGFNTFSGFLSGGNNYFTRERCQKGKCGYDWWSSPKGHSNDTFGEYSTKLFARKSIDAIKNRDSTKPFFLYLAYQTPHTPLQVPEKYKKKFEHIHDRKRRQVAGMVAALDDSVGEVINYLKDDKILDNTIIVFSTDNGGATHLGGNNWPLRGGKSSPWEGGMRAVGFVHGKRLGVSNVTYNGLMHVTDWFPTFLNAAGCAPLESDNNLDGISQWDSICKNTASKRTEILHTINEGIKRGKSISSLFDTSITAAIRSGPWKLITGNQEARKKETRNNVRPPESKMNTSINIIEKGQIPGINLFNIGTDPYEHHDLASQRPDIVYTLLKRLAHYKSTALPIYFPRDDPEGADPQLRGGYWGPWQQ